MLANFSGSKRDPPISSHYYGKPCTCNKNDRYCCYSYFRIDLLILVIEKPFKYDYVSFCEKKYSEDMTNIEKKCDLIFPDIQGY